MIFAELDEKVSRMAEALEEYGLSGGRIGLYLKKDAGHIAAIYALIRAGCVAVQINTRTPPPEVPDLLRRAGCTSLITDDPDDETSGKLDCGEGIRTFGIPTLRDKYRVPSNPDKEIPRIDLSQSATIVFTSGSTGTPKAALHTFGNHYASAVGSAKNIPLEAGDVWLHSLPLFHVGGLSILFRCAITGATIALPNTNESTGESIRSSGATHVSLVATQLRRLLDEGEDLFGLKAILLGGSGIPETLLDRAHELGLPVHTSYGLTEMSSQVTTTAPKADREELATSGHILPHRDLRISGDGEILVRGDTLFCGYVEGDRISHLFDEDGWFHTKDIGWMDERGLLIVTGRLDNLFISGGENIQPEEIEESLRRINGIEDAVVVPVPDEEFGERPVAFVRGRIPPDIEQILRQNLPGYKVPVAFYGWPDDAPSGMKTDRRFFGARAISHSSERS